MTPHPETKRALARAVAVAADPAASTQQVDLALTLLAHEHDEERHAIVAGARLSRLDRVLWGPTIARSA